MDFTKYEHEIAEPRETRVRPHQDPWHGVEIVLEVERIPTTHTLALTVEEAFNLRDQLTAYLAETYPATRESVTVHMVFDCVFCGRGIIEVDGIWVDPQATGDDEVWRETCDSSPTFVAGHSIDPLATS